MIDLEILQKKFNKRIKKVTKPGQERVIFIPPRSDGNYDIRFNHHGIKRNYKKYREGQKSCR